MSRATLNTEVTKFLDEQNHPFRKEIEQLRQCILNTANELTENIKWNGPNYSIDNKDRITMKIQPPKKIQLVFHRGAKVQEQPKERLIKEEFKMLDWKGNDRAIATFNNMQDIHKGEADLKIIITEWIKATKYLE
ncbi:MAG TPA: DUF1801 domain-containing protein [Sphingobacteriaceae bacterium]